MSFANKIREAMKVDKIKNHCKYSFRMEDWFISDHFYEEWKMTVVPSFVFGMEISIYFSFSTLMASPRVSSYPPPPPAPSVFSFLPQLLV